MAMTALVCAAMILAMASVRGGYGAISTDYNHNQDFDMKYQIKPPACHISSAELLATARTTTQDILRGVCDPKDLESRLAVMENLLTDQLNVLKTMILNVEDKLGSQEDHYKKQFRRIQAILMRKMTVPSIPTTSASTSASAGSNKVSNSVGTQATIDDSYYGRHAAARMLTHPSGPTSQSISTNNPSSSKTSSDIADDTEDESLIPALDTNTNLASSNNGQQHTSSSGGPTSVDHVFGTDTMQEVADNFRISYLDQGQDVGKVEAGSRQYEIDTYNATISDFNGQRVFRFYWKVKDINYKITSWGQRRSLRSESFYTFTYGYRMYIRIYPKHNGENFYIHVGVTQGDYDQMLEWPFKLKHFITVLDFSQEKPEDLNSRVWDPKELCSGWNWRRPSNGDNYECVGLGFPIDLLRSRKYIVDDSVVLRLTVFLDSH